MIDKSFLEKVAELAGPATVEIDGLTYRKSAYTIAEPPRVATIIVHTLSGLVDYVQANPDGIGRPICHVVGPAEVRLFSPASRGHRQREEYIRAVPVIEPFEFNRFHSLKNFIIQLQSRFVPTAQTAELLRIVGNLTDSVVKNFDDDGVTQQVTVKTGIAKVENAIAPNRLLLKPYRTFIDIGQPEGEFIFRLEAGPNGGQPSAALFESDGGAWKLAAINGIAEYLKQHVADVVTILA